MLSDNFFFPPIGLLQSRLLVVFTSTGLYNLFFLPLFFIQSLFTEKFTTIFCTVSTTNSLSECEVGSAFPQGNLDNKSVNPISFPGMCLILKLNGKSRFTQRFSLLCIVCYSDMHLMLITMPYGSLRFRIKHHTSNFLNALSPRLLPTIQVHLSNIYCRDYLKIGKRMLLLTNSPDPIVLGWLTDRCEKCLSLVLTSFLCQNDCSLLFSLSVVLVLQTP